ncbi:MAG: hypothetical protein JWP44_943 [Mucilaginibacter sp.]|nr:hypothetical protein [Mucilaginibacter sp.]
MCKTSNTTQKANLQDAIRLLVFLSMKCTRLSFACILHNYALRFPTIFRR